MNQILQTHFHFNGLFYDMLTGIIEKYKKKEGFQGQKAVVIPRKILTAFHKKNSLNQPLYITDIGYYPKAKYHYREL